VAFTYLIESNDATLRQFEQNVVDGQLVVRAVPMRIFVEKNRNGPIGKTPEMLWDKALNRFGALTLQEPPRQSRRSAQRPAAQPPLEPQ
jgi:hypothetical protein